VNLFQKGIMVVMRCMMIMFCLLLSSCTKQVPHQQQPQIMQTADNTQDHSLDVIIQQEAMLIDVPIPLFDERIIIPSSAQEDGNFVLGYKSPLSREQTIDFFMHHMERLGWEHLVSFEGPHTLVQFKSPYRYCTVLIKNNESSEHVSIFIYIKRASTNACPLEV